jgi:hypothetical protein
LSSIPGDLTLIQCYCLIHGSCSNFTNYSKAVSYSEGFFPHSRITC